MSKTTIALIIMLLVFTGLLFFIVHAKQQNLMISTLTKPLLSRLIPVQSTLAFSETHLSVNPAQTVTIPVLIHNANPALSVVQLEIGYDPTAVIVDQITPGSFFIKPAVVLENIDPVAGRISYALRCPGGQTINNTVNCENANSNIVANITLSINPYDVQNDTTLSFYPKTVIRSSTGRDILISTSSLKLIINKPEYPVSSSSAIIRTVTQTPIK